MNNIIFSKKRVLVLAGIVALVLIWLFGVKTPAYKVYIDGEEKFIAKNQKEVLAELEEIKNKIQSDHQQKLEFCTSIEFSKTFAQRKEIFPAEKIYQELYKNVEFRTLAAAIVVDGNTVAYVNSKDEADKLLDKLLEEYSKVETGERLVDVSFEEKVEVKEIQASVDQINTLEEAYALIKTGSPNPEKYIVEEGDSLWLIARRNDMYVDDIVRANNLKTDRLSLGQELIISKNKPYINVVTTVEGSRDEIIPYETKVIIDNNSSSSIKVRQAGENGEKHIIYVASRINGVLIQQEVKEEKIIKNAVDRVIVKGNNITQVASRGGGSTGELDWPVYGPITQYYKGTQHTGLDIGGQSGTAIKAADAGKVTFAGWLGSYGRFIVVDHGNGIVTRYAHCSSIGVTNGQQVARGEKIGTLGSTGRSTGPHLHFEVLVNGSFKNPLNYLR
ncbi:MAG: peptidoglycan DD-metalloendopeptidase family protein [Syntrophomonadaceae bacterium]|jgi:murein DD-endopeptidase MepM/ murein hydrolase activator NlpD